jgi:hypothetical protein
LPTPNTTFRLTEDDREGLDVIASAWGVSRTDALRKLIGDEIERSQLHAQAAQRFISGLCASHGQDAVLEVNLEGDDLVQPESDAVKVDGSPLTGAKVTVIDLLDGRLELVLDIEDSVSLPLATLTALPTGAQWSHSVPLAALARAPEGTG